MAYVASEEYDYSIIIYEVIFFFKRTKHDIKNLISFQLETIKINVRFIGHKKFVYHLNWSEDDQYLLSVSSDQTARLWDVCNKIIQPIQVKIFIFPIKFTMNIDSTMNFRFCYIHRTCIVENFNKNNR